MSEELTQEERVALFTAAKAEWLPSISGSDPLEVAVVRILCDRRKQWEEFVREAVE